MNLTLQNLNRFWINFKGNIIYQIFSSHWYVPLAIYFLFEFSHHHPNSYNLFFNFIQFFMKIIHSFSKLNNWESHSNYNPVLVMINELTLNYFHLHLLSKSRRSWFLSLKVLNQKIVVPRADIKYLISLVTVIHSTLLHLSIFENYLCFMNFQFFILVPLTLILHFWNLSLQYFYLL